MDATTEGLVKPHKPRKMPKPKRAAAVAHDGPAPQTVGGRLRQAREANKLSLAEVGERLGVSKAAVGAWEVDRNKPVYKHLLLAADLYRTTAQWLMDGQGAPPEPISEGAASLDPAAELQQTLKVLQAAGFEPTEIIPVPGGRYQVKFRRRHK